MRSTDLARPVALSLGLLVCAVAFPAATPAGEGKHPSKVGQVTEIKNYVRLNGKLFTGRGPYSPAAS
jgi:hypothetical protein